VVSWNVLCPQLCTDIIFPHSRLPDLDDDIRWGRVLRKLSEKVEENAVICLQELSQDWCARLHVFFLKSDYCLVSSNYGKEGDGYMGVAVAFPRRLYDLPAVSIKRVSEALPRHHSPTEGQGHDHGNSPSSWTISRSRQNRMISLRLRPRGTTYADKDFVVSTYHMPCFFRDMKVMVIHASLAAQCALEFAGDLPLILAGDFNFRPGSAPYALLTNGSLPKEHHDHPGPCEDWDLDSSLRVLRSAYNEKHPSGEPNFTNYSWTKEDADPFIGTLDYIFVSKHPEVLQVDRLPTLHESRDHLPHEHEPSDHLMISARLLPHGKAAIQPVSNGRMANSFQRPEAKAKPSNGNQPVQGRGRSFGSSGSFLRRPLSLSKATKTEK